MKRERKLLFNLLDQLDKELSDSLEIFFEERPYLWEKAGIDKVRKNLEEAGNQNRYNILTLIGRIEELI